MPKPTYVPVNPSVLNWAIEESGFTPAGLGKRLDIPETTLLGWSTGEAMPTKTQFRKLADALQRPTAIFFLPKPPPSEIRSVQYRSAMGSGRTSSTPVEARSIAAGARLQKGARWIVQQAEMSQKLPAASIEGDPASAATAFRSFLAIDVQQQLRWTDPAMAFRVWRAYLEAHGWIVAQASLGSAGIRGFSLSNDVVPLVAINSAYRTTARIFTLFHEVAHTITQTSSACIGFSQPQSKEVTERWCEEFAASLLLPRSAFENYLRQRFGAPELKSASEASAVASAFKVSVRATALRAIRLGWADRDLYSEVETQFPKLDFLPAGGGGGGMPASARRLEQLGIRLPNLFVLAVDKRWMTERDALDYLRLNTNGFDEMKSILSVRT